MSNALLAFQDYGPASNGSSQWPLAPMPSTANGALGPEEANPYFAGVQVQFGGSTAMNQFADVNGFPRSFFTHTGDVKAGTFYGSNPQSVKNCGCNTEWIQFGPLVFVIFTNNVDVANLYKAGGGIGAMLFDAINQGVG